MFDKLLLFSKINYFTKKKIPFTLICYLNFNSVQALIHICEAQSNWQMVTASPTADQNLNPGYSGPEKGLRCRWMRWAWLLLIR